MLVLDQRCVRPEPGVLVQWVPSESTRLAAASTTPRPGARPTLLQVVHLHGSLSRAGQGLPHTGFIGTSVDVPRRLDRADLGEALRRFVVRHEVLRASYHPTEGGFDVHVVAPEAISYTAVRIGVVDERSHVLLDDGSFSGPMADFLASHLGALTDPFTWPVATMLAVEHDDATTVLFACDHTVSDGVSQALAVHEILDHHAAAVEGVESPLLASPAESFLDYADSEARRAADATDDPLVTEMVELFGRNGHAMPRFAADLGLAPGETAPTVGAKFPLMASTSVPVLEDILRSHGSRLLPGLFALMAVTDFEVTGQSRYFAITVRNTRGEDHISSQGWFCHYLPVLFDIGEARTFTGVLAIADQAYRRGRAMSAAPLEAVVSRLLAVDGVDPLGVLAEPQMVSYLDFRWFPGAASPTWADSFIFAGDGETANALMWFNRDDHHLHLDTHVPATLRARRIVRGWHTRLAAVLEDVMNHGDHILGPAGDESVIERFIADETPMPPTVLEPLRGSSDPLIERVIEKMDLTGDATAVAGARAH